MRVTAAHLLNDLGYTVLQARDADRALAVIESGVRIDLLFTDVVMPGKVTSRELADRARQLIPQLPVLFTSGYTRNSIVHGGRLDPGVQLLSKPYTQEQLALKIREVLGEPSAPAPVTAAAPTETAMPTGRAAPAADFPRLRPTGRSRLLKSGRSGNEGRLLISRSGPCLRSSSDTSISASASRSRSVL